jgi:hypothetical protein
MKKMICEVPVWGEHFYELLRIGLQLSVCNAEISNSISKISSNLDSDSSMLALYLPNQIGRLIPNFAQQSLE